jgi:hypothetical protein
MSTQHLNDSTQRLPATLESRLAAYLAAAGGAATMVTSVADAAVVANTMPQAVGINQEVNIDFNTDGQIDFQIDHDRFDLNGTNLDYLQIDKNDVNGAANPLPIDPLVSFPVGSTAANDTFQTAYVIDGPTGSYPAALTEGSDIGPSQTFDFQEGDNFTGSGQTIRANRLIDEDQGQIDREIGGLAPEQVYQPLTDPSFVGLGGEVRYLGLKMDLNNTDQLNYGWIGIRIDNEADATATVVGYGYESTPGVAILAGDTGPFVANADYDDDGDVDGRDFLVWQRAFGSTVANGTGADGNGDGTVNAGDLSLWESQFAAGATAAESPFGTPVPEPGSLLMASLGLALLVSWIVVKRGFRRLIPIRCR